MAMTMNGEYELPVPPQTVWEKLNDTATLKACIPGCEQLDKTSDTEFQAVATVKIGPVKAKFKGKVTLSDLDPPNGYKISGQGDGGVAGFAKGGATVKLTPKNGGTLLAYTVEASPERYYVVAEGPQVPRFEQLVGKPALHTVAASGGKFLFSNF